MFIRLGRGSAMILGRSAEMSGQFGDVGDNSEDQRR